MDKVDVELIRLIEAHAAGELEVDPENPDQLVHVYVAVANDDFGALASVYDVSSELGGTAIVTLAIPDIETLAARDDVIGVFAPMGGHPLADREPVVFTDEQVRMSLKKANDLTSSTRAGSLGEDVYIGIVDTGVNILHDAFTETVMENGKKVRKTRIKELWAQRKYTKLGKTDLWFRNGKRYTDTEINTLIAKFDADGTLPPDEVLDRQKGHSEGHGTHVASIAGGSAWSAAPEKAGYWRGVAPKAKFIVVANANKYDTDAAIHYCYDAADRLGSLPCVVNMSLASYLMPHNGYSLFDLRLRERLTEPSGSGGRREKEGRAFVVAAGNEGINHLHVRVSVPAGGAVSLPFKVDPKSEQLNFFISSTKANLRVSVSPPPKSGARQYSPVGPFSDTEPVSGHSVRIKKASETVTRPNAANMDADPHFHTTLVAWTQTKYIRAGAWALKLEAAAGEEHPAVDVWLSDYTKQFIKPTDVSQAAKEDVALDVELPAGVKEKREKAGTDPYDGWRRPKPWIHSTLNGMACGRDAIVVGATYFTPTAKLISPRRFSGRGPATEPARAAVALKPDLAAPGFEVVGAEWKKPKKNASGPPGHLSMFTRGNGSSLAAPFVTGAVALMFSHKPSLNNLEIRTILHLSAQKFDAKVRKLVFEHHPDPNLPAHEQGADITELNISGWGYLDLEAALKKMKERHGG